MYRKDYIMRMVEDFGRLLNEIIHLRKESKLTEAEKKISAAGEVYFTFSFEEVLNFPDDGLREELISKKKLHPQQIRMLAEIFFQKGWIFLDKNENLKINYFKRSLTLFKMFLELEPSLFDVEVIQRLSILHDLCSSTGLN